MVLSTYTFADSILSRNNKLFVVLMCDEQTIIDFPSVCCFIEIKNKRLFVWNSKFITINLEIDFDALEPSEVSNCIVVDNKTIKYDLRLCFILEVKSVRLKMMQILKG